MIEKKSKSVVTEILPDKVNFNQSVIKWSTFVLMSLLLIYITILLIIIFGSKIAIYDEIIENYTILGEIFIASGVILGVFLVLDIIIILMMDDESKIREEFIATAIAPLCESPKSLDAIKVNIGENLTKKQYRRNTKTKVFTAFGTLGIGLIVIGLATGFIALDNYQKPIPTKYIETEEEYDPQNPTLEGRTVSGFTKEFNNDWTKHSWNTLSLPSWIYDFQLKKDDDVQSPATSFAEVFDSIDPSHKLRDSITNIKMSDKMELNSNTLKAGLFNNCNFKSTITLSSTIKTIGSNAFANNNYGTAVNFSSKLENIGANAFANFGSDSKNMRNIVKIPASIVKVGDNAFSNYGSKDDTNSIVEFSDCSNLDGSDGLGEGSLDMFQNAGTLDVYLPKINTNFTWNHIFGNNLSEHKTIKLHLPKTYNTPNQINAVANSIGIGPEDIVANL